jgi:hypothetical protein
MLRGASCHVGGSQLRGGGMVGDLLRRIYCGWAPRWIQTAGCRAGARW